VSGEAEKSVDWYSFTTGYEAGAASRDAEVAALEAVIEKTVETVRRDQEALKNLDPTELLVILAAPAPAPVLAARIREAKAEGVAAAQDRLVNRDQFSERTLRLLDELAAEYRSGTTTEGNRDE
jgi:hypothetical protein